MLLTIFVSLQFKYSQSFPFYRPKLTVYITSNLTDLELGVHCKDKNNDIKFQKLQFGESYTFTFRPNVIVENSLYFCGFSWFNEFHYFDIYVEQRDEDTCKTECHWKIYKTGPCKLRPTFEECYHWHPNVVVKGK